MTSSVPLCGVILAGGQSSRMQGQDKGLLEINGQTLLKRVIDRAQPQVTELLISTNSPSVTYQQQSLPLLADNLDGFLGPLSGVLTAMEWCQLHRPQYEWLASFAVDTPCFPENLCQRLADEITPDADIICPVHTNSQHPTFCLWRINQAAELRQYLLDGNSRMSSWLDNRKTQSLILDGNNDDHFFNINTPAQLTEAQKLISTKHLPRSITRA